MDAQLQYVTMVDAQYVTMVDAQYVTMVDAQLQYVTKLYTKWLGREWFVIPCWSAYKQGHVTSTPADIFLIG